SLLDDVSPQFRAEAGRRPLAEMATRHLRDGRTLQITRGAVLAQVTTHGMHHRAQCLNMLRRLGVNPLPPSSVAEWTWMGEGHACRAGQRLRSPFLPEGKNGGGERGWGHRGGRGKTADFGELSSSLSLRAEGSRAAVGFATAPREPTHPCGAVALYS